MVGVGARVRGETLGDFLVCAVEAGSLRVYLAPEY